MHTILYGYIVYLFTKSMLIIVIIIIFESFDQYNILPYSGTHKCTTDEYFLE